MNPAPIFNVILMFIGYAIYNKKEIYPNQRKEFTMKKYYIYSSHVLSFLLLQDAVLQRKILPRLPQHRKLQQQLPLQKIPLILLPLIQMPRMILMIFQLIKKNQKLTKKVNNAASSSNASVNENVFTL